MFDSHVSRRIWITEAAMFVEIGVTLSSIFGFLLFLDWIFRKETKINGAHVVITGGSRGIGLALAIQMAECGANVTLIAKNKPRLEEARQKVERNLCPNKKAVCFSVDLADDPTEVEATINKASNLLGPVDILVNCAGYAVCGLFEETPVIDFKNQIHVNYLGSVYPTLAVVKSMKERRRGHIVLVSSMGGQIGLFGYTAYTPSKFAVRGFAESLFMEVKPYNVGVSVVFPPDTDTPGFENENKTKPEETHIISNSGGLFTPDQVACRIINGIKTRQYLISIGFDGFNLKTLTCGTAPVSSWIELLLQVCLMGPLRFVSIFYAMYHDYVVRQGMKKRLAAAKRK